MRRFKKNPGFGLLKLHKECEYRDQYEPRTRPGLAYTPRQMVEMWQQGIPISAASAAATPADYGNTVEVPIYLQKSVDPSDVWQEQMSARKRIEAAINEKRKKR